MKQARRVVTPAARMLAVAALLTGLSVCVESTSARRAQPVIAAGTSLESLLPARLLETRTGPGAVTVDGAFAGVGVRPAGSTVELLVAGRGGVPANASAVMLNLTVVAPAGPGFATVWPCGGPMPTASNINYAAGVVVANAVLAKVGVDGKVCVYTHAATDLVVDVNGFVTAGSVGGLESLLPARLLETRTGPGAVTVDGAFAGVGVRPAGSTVELLVAGRGGVPANASAVMLNLTVVAPAGPGFATVWPCGGPMPTASNINYAAGVVVANAVLAKVGVDGKVCVYTHAATDLVVDVNGFVAAGSVGGLESLLPARLLETRRGRALSRSMAPSRVLVFVRRVRRWSCWWRVVVVCRPTHRR